MNLTTPIESSVNFAVKLWFGYQDHWRVYSDITELAKVAHFSNDIDTFRGGVTLFL